MAQKPSEVVEEVVETAANLLILGIGTAAMHGARFAARMRELIDEFECDFNHIRFQFTAKAGQVYWRRKSGCVWIGVNRKSLKHHGVFPYVTLRVPVVYGVPHFDAQDLERVVILFEDPAYEGFRQDQVTLDFFSDPRVFGLVTPNPTKYRLAKIRKELAVARAERARVLKKRKAMQKKVRDLFGLSDEAKSG